MSLLSACASSSSSAIPSGVSALATVQAAAKTSELLFVSDLISGDIYVLTIPDLQLKQTLRGFESVGGLCADTAGNVWVTDASAQTIAQYSRAGKLLRTLTVPGGSGACAIDAKSGDLAVSNVGFNSQPGAIYVFPRATGTPRTVTNANVQSYGYLGYDNDGNLFFGGLQPESSDFNLIISEAAAGQSTAHEIDIPGAPSKFASGMVEWDARRRRLLVGDVYCHNAYATCIYEIAISGSIGRIKRIVSLKNTDGGQACAVWQAVLLPGSRALAGGDSEAGCSSTPSTVGVWSLRRGGKPSRFNDGIPSLTLPLGAALSIVKKPPT